MAERVKVWSGRREWTAEVDRVELWGPDATRLLEGIALGRVPVSVDGAALSPPFGWLPPDRLPFPHLSARENLGYTGASRARVDAVAERLGLTEVLDRRSRSLDRAQRERVALGRAVLASDRLWLLDGVGALAPLLDPPPGVVILARDFAGAATRWEV